MPARPPSLPARARFQSAPGLEAGRCQLLHHTIDAVAAFQSAPGLEAGRCMSSRQASLMHGRSFNPRPALRPGDARVDQYLEAVVQVSIRARP